MDISTAVAIALVLLIGPPGTGTWISGTSVAGGRTAIPGSHGGSRGGTPTSARTLVGPRLTRHGSDDARGARYLARASFAWPRSTGTPLTAFL